MTRPSASRAPKHLEPSFNCPYAECGALAHQSWVDLCYADDDDGQPYSSPLEIVNETTDGLGEDPWATQEVRTWTAARCWACKRWSIWHRHLLVHPRNRVVGLPAHSDMSKDAQALYAEAAAVAAVSRRAGAALARATVEFILRELDPDAPSRANLDARIGRIRHRVSSHLGDMLDVLRITGNAALHVDDQPAELITIALDDTEGPQLIEEFLQTANALVDELVTRPNTVRRYREKLPAAVRDKLDACEAASDG